jgi:hypothetical protein
MRRGGRSKGVAEVGVGQVVETMILERMTTRTMPVAKENDKDGVVERCDETESEVLEG